MVFLSFSLLSCSPKVGQGAWILACAAEEDPGSCGYKDAEGNIQIAFGKYPICFTDTFNQYAIVLKPEIGFVGIDRTEKVLYEVFLFDNGPDYPSEGLFRIVENGVIGYAELASGAILIKPQYAAARPFQNGYAPVCPDCETVQDGEYSRWVNGKWGLIGRDGEVVLAPQFDGIKQVEPDGRVLVVENGAEQWVEIE